ncbi:hypothetical protein [Clostridium polynesiense]|uniref:hypothetical protein n=1 Tax=Clostridium polynesiense TaxID=1325933 RepID=UPI00058E1DF4|nr:hypothetical protein [Clostridium polynesiense]
MREVVSMSKDYISGVETKEKKYKSDNFKTTVTALLYDSNGKMVQEHITENIVHTKHIDFQMFMTYFTNHWNSFLAARFTPQLLTSTYLLVLTDYNGAENAENLYKRGNVLAYASRADYVVTPTPKRGYMNTAESVRTSINKLKLVFDFPQETGNGTFQSLWFSEHTDFIEACGTLNTISGGSNSSYHYKNIICDNEGYWFVTNSTEIVKNKWIGDEVSGSRINVYGIPTNIQTTFNPSFIRLLHISTEGAIYVESRGTTNKLYKISADRKLVTVLNSNFYDIFGTTYYNNNIYWLCRVTGTSKYVIGKMDISKFERLEDFTLDEVNFSDIDEILKSIYPEATSFQYNQPTMNISIFEDKLALAIDGTYNNSVYISRIALLDIATLSYVSDFYSICRSVGLGPYAGNFSSSSPTGTSVSSSKVYKFINNGTHFISTDMAICVVSPPYSHAKLSAPITKDNSQSMKIIYELEFAFPDGWNGNPTVKF